MRGERCAALPSHALDWGLELMPRHFVSKTRAHKIIDAAQFPPSHESRGDHLLAFIGGPSARPSLREPRKNPHGC
jgi:hypothetical protein